MEEHYFDQHATWAYIYKAKRDPFTGDPTEPEITPALRLGYVAITSLFPDGDCLLTHVPTGMRMGEFLPISIAKDACVRMFALGDQMNSRDPEAVRSAAGPILEEIGHILPTWRETPFKGQVPDLPPNPQPNPAV